MSRFMTGQKLTKEHKQNESLQRPLKEKRSGKKRRQKRLGRKGGMHAQRTVF